jgi:uncharacterized protein (DUF2141 family)
MKYLMQIIVFTALLTAFAGFRGAGGQASNKVTGSIVVTVVQIDIAEGGNLVVSLYDGKDRWLKTEKALKTEIIPAEEDSSVVAFEDLPFDSVYAVAVIHDRNMNGRLDMRRFPWPKPKEGAGVSNNRFGFGPPDYDDAMLRLDVPMIETRIEMRY